MLNAKRIFFIVLSNIGVRLFRRRIYSTSNSQPASAARGFERAHAQKHPITNGYPRHYSNEREPTDTRIGERTRLACWFRRPRRNNLLFPYEAHEAHGDILNQENENRRNGTSEIESRAASVARASRTVSELANQEKEQTSCVPAFLIRILISSRAIVPGTEPA